MQILIFSKILQHQRCVGGKFIGGGKNSGMGTMEVNIRYEGGYELLVDSFEQVIAKSTDTALRTTARSRRSVLDLVCAPTLWV